MNTGEKLICPSPWACCSWMKLNGRTFFPFNGFAEMAMIMEKWPSVFLDRFRLLHISFHFQLTLLSYDSVSFAINKVVAFIGNDSFILICFLRSFKLDSIFHFSFYIQSKNIKMFCSVSSMNNYVCATQLRASSPSTILFHERSKYWVPIFNLTDDIYTS